MLEKTLRDLDRVQEDWARQLEVEAKELEYKLKAKRMSGSLDESGAVTSLQPLPRRKCAPVPPPPLPNIDPGAVLFQKNWRTRHRTIECLQRGTFSLGYRMQQLQPRLRERNF